MLDATASNDPAPAYDGMPLTSDQTPVTKDDKATGALLQNILDCIAELEQDEAFSGFTVEQARDGEGRLLFVRLIPCDRIGDVTSPRVA